LLRSAAMGDTQTEQGVSAPRYDFDRIDPNSGSVHADVVGLVGESRRVLEVGTATGYMSRALAERGCTVVGIELDPDMAESAGELCERMIVGDVEALDLERELEGERFDAIVAADVLEHLKDPLRLLRRLRPFLTADGCFVISVPNVAHGSVRLALLSGRFDYQDIGLLDETHLRFFTRETLEQLLDEAELGLAELHRHDLALEASEVRFDRNAVSAELLEEINEDPDARTYQYVAKAIPMPTEGLREVQRRLREVVELRLRAERVEELEGKLAEIAGREAELRRALIDAHDQLLQRDQQVAEMTVRVRRIERLKASLPGRVLLALRRFPGARALERRLRALLSRVA
jgi:O-antigen biosynthesis protein